MRSILGILLLLLGVGLVSCRIDGRSADATVPPPRSDWVRTVDGWERPQYWSLPYTQPPALHPLVVAAGQAFLSLFALAAVGGPIDRHPRGQ